jgi:hypothetical protein
MSALAESPDLVLVSIEVVAPVVLEEALVAPKVLASELGNDDAVDVLGELVLVLSVDTLRVGSGAFDVLLSDEELELLGLVDDVALVLG